MARGFQGFSSLRIAAFLKSGTLRLDRPAPPTGRSEEAGKVSDDSSQVKATDVLSVGRERQTREPVGVAVMVSAKVRPYELEPAEARSKAFLRAAET